MSGPNAEAQEAILIRAASTYNGLTFAVVGALICLLGAILLSILPVIYSLPSIFVICIGMVGMLLGGFKLREPKYSFELNKNEIVYHHRKGQWRIAWQNIQRIDIPRVTRGIEQHDLEMIGFKMRNSDDFLRSISPRLTTYLLLEQRPLVTQSNDANCKTGQCYGDDLIEDQKYQTNDGRLLKGVEAMFANRMQRLRNNLGYDVYISSNEIDRDAAAFVQLLRECQESVMSAEVR